MIRLLSILLLLSAWAAEGATWLMPTNTAFPNTSPGDTVIVTNGVWTNGITINNANSGVTVTYLPGAVFNQTCWTWHTTGDQMFSSQLGALTLQYPSNIVIHGNGCIISNSGCGTLFSNKNTTAIAGAGLNIVLDNFICTNLYQHTLYSDDQIGGAGVSGTAIDLTGSGIIVSNCDVSWATSGISINAGNGIAGQTNAVAAGNNQIVWNRINYCVHYISPGLQITNCVMTNTTISYNTMDNCYVWDGNSSYHLDYMYYTDGNTTDTNDVWQSGMYVDHNYFGANFMGVFTNNQVFTNIMQNVNGTWSTNTTDTYAHKATSVNNMYYQSHSMMESQNAWFYCNVIASHGDTYTNIGTSYTWGNIISANGSNCGCLYNSVIVIDPVTNAAGTSFSVGGTNGFSLGNISGPRQGGETFSIVTQTNYTSAGTAGNGAPTAQTLGVWTNYFALSFVSDYNLFTTNGTGSTGSGDPSFSISGGPSYSAGDSYFLFGGFYYSASPNQWTNFNGRMPNAQPQLDPHSQLANPVFTAGTWIPAASDTVARAKGTNLTTFAANYHVPRLTLDFNNNPRPSSGNWTNGAFEVNTNAAAATTYFLPIRNF